MDEVDFTIKLKKIVGSKIKSLTWDNAKRILTNNEYMAVLRLLGLSELDKK